MSSSELSPRGADEILDESYENRSADELAKALRDDGAALGEALPKPDQRQDLISFDLPSEDAELDDTLALVPKPTVSLPKTVQREASVSASASIEKKLDDYRREAQAENAEMRARLEAHIRAFERSDTLRQKEITDLRGMIGQIRALLDNSQGRVPDLSALPAGASAPPPSAQESSQSGSQLPSGAVASYPTSSNVARKKRHGSAF